MTRLGKKNSNATVSNDARTSRAQKVLKKKKKARRKAPKVKVLPAEVIESELSVRVDEAEDANPVQQAGKSEASSPVQSGPAPLPRKRASKAALAKKRKMRTALARRVWADTTAMHHRKKVDPETGATTVTKSRNRIGRLALNNIRRVVVDAANKAALDAAREEAERDAAAEAAADREEAERNAAAEAAADREEAERNAAVPTDNKAASKGYRMSPEATAKLHEFLSKRILGLVTETVILANHEGRSSISIGNLETVLEMRRSRLVMCM